MPDVVTPQMYGAMRKRKIQLMLILDTDETPNIEEIKNDLEREIRCASYYYEIDDIKEVTEQC